MNDTAPSATTPEAATVLCNRAPRPVVATPALRPGAAESHGVAASTIWERSVAGHRSTLPPPRLLVVLAHPDDEVLALGARLERLS